MGRKSKQKRSDRERAQGATREILSQASSVAGTRYKHPWVPRLIAAVGIPLLLLALIEGGLRLSDYGHPTDFFLALDGKRVTTNPTFAWQFHSRKTASTPVPQVFNREKSPGVKRVFVLGESAAAGTPDPAFGFWRMLDAMLAEQFPGERFEIINAAMRGIDSHIIRSIARECAKFSPDLFVVYAGNNEMVGIHAPTPGKRSVSRALWWIQLQHAMNRLKLVQAGGALLGSRKESSVVQDQAFFRSKRVAFDDPLRLPNYEHFGANLREICRTSEKAGARTLLCTVVVNLRDFPPIASLNRTDLSAEQLATWQNLYREGMSAESARDFTLAAAKYAEAAKIDDRYAELHFRQAGLLELVGQHEAAHRSFQLARDLDAMQFRTDSRMNSTIREVAKSAGASVRLLDLESLAMKSALAQNGIPGDGLLHEHVHFNFDGDHYVASTLLPEVAGAFGLKTNVTALPRDKCADLLAYTVVDDFNVRSAMNRMLSSPPFQDQLEFATRGAVRSNVLQALIQKVGLPEFQRADSIYREALKRRPNDHFVQYNHGNLLKQMGQKQAAEAQFAAASASQPYWTACRLARANLLLEMGRWAEAKPDLEAILRMDPYQKPVQQALAMAKARSR